MSEQDHGGTEKAVTEDEIMITAQLAALDLDRSDRDRFATALNEILHHFEAISQIDVAESSEISPVVRQITVDSLRSDQPVVTQVADVRNAAPDFEEDFFFVPRVIL